ncbi:MAG: radical SAM protein, partial [Deltaproteobacteria bacterium]|nr:radical SAM protein [Deltaproteobacteria bacterium]
KKSMGAKVRKRPAASVVDEIEWLRRDFGVDEIHFMDDNFSMHAQYVRDICEDLLLRDIRIPWACPNGLRLDSLDAELLRLMERAGCYSMAVGIESGSDRTLAAIRKHLDTSTIRRQIELIKRETRIRITGFFIVGLPGETQIDIETTIRFARELPLDRANFFNYSPFPGSSIYESLKESGEIERIDPSDLYIHHVVYSPDQLPIEKLRALQRRAHLAFYLRPRILMGLAREIRSWFQLRVLVSRAFKLLLG